MRTKRQKLERLRADVAVGVEQARRGETRHVSLEELVARLPENRARVEALRARVDPALWAKAFGPGAWKGAGIRSRQEGEP